MNKKAHQIELIEKFIGKNATEKEAEEFDKLISENQSFQNLYKEMAAIIPGIENSARKSLLNNLKEFDAGLPEIQAHSIIHPKRKIRWIAWSAAVAACLVGLVLSITLINSGNNKYNEIYSQYYKPYNSLTIANDRSTDITDPIKTEAFGRYATGDYAKAIEQLEKLNTTGQDTEILFYLASAYMATGQMAKAEENFNLVLTKESLFSDQARWYLALCYLKTNQPDKAREKLKELTNYNNTCTKNAKEILYLVK